MKILSRNKEEFKLKIENADDLWYLSTIVDAGDLVKGKSLRKIKIGDSSQGNVKIIKKPVFLEIKVEKVEFAETSNVLRVLGIITQSPEEVEHGDHHSFALEEGSIITIHKEEWLAYQTERLREAAAEKQGRILIVIHDREEAFFALMKKAGYTLLSHITGDVQKKGDDKSITKNFYREILDLVQEYVDRYTITSVVMASPAFWKEELAKELKDEVLKKKIIFATCATVGKTAIAEVLRRDEVKKALQQDRMTHEVNLVEDLLTEIKKNNCAAYGIKQTEEATNAGAVKDLLVADSFIQESRRENFYNRLDAIMKTTESTKGKVHIISAEHEAGKKLTGLGGIAALLRYKLSY